ncbi:hypothetical protein KP79_PYT03200 [Mizuhopecten yessoensis]|uniref:Uncharacterized protein n=1 Tax=Mizuhopecten yessoensis TaxID=6573 RepID=A0A210PIV9_MIZYE|nr:hypothetical protein KP79_PYT03200 [Mizuhopecten yessoensis]
MELGDPYAVLKNQKIGLTVGVSLCLFVLYVVVAVAVYKPVRERQPRPYDANDVAM